MHYTAISLLIVLVIPLLAGLALIVDAMTAWNQAKQYSLARHTMHRKWNSS